MAALSARTVFWSTAAFLFVGLLALLAIIGATWWLNERAQVYFGQALEARDTRAAAAELRNAVQTAESSQRGFVLTGNEIYLAPFDTAKAQANRQLTELERLLAADPAAAAIPERLTSLVEQKFAEMDETIALKRARRDAEALALVRTNRGKALTDEANVFFSGIIRRADERLTADVEEQAANAGLLRLVAALGGVLIAAVVGGAGLIVYQHARDLRTARDEVHDLNAALEQRVADRTADLVLARDRAETLLSEVNHRVANSLALVSSLVSMQAKSMPDEAAKKALVEAQQRIFAVALVHRELYSSGDVRTVTLDEYLSSLLEHLKTSLLGGGATALSYTLEPVKLSTDTSINLGVVVTEWVTNAFKYAYPDGGGEIRVRLRQLSNEKAEMVVEDDGVGRSETEMIKGTGLGSRIVSAMAATIGAEIEYQPRRPGTAARLVFPAALAEQGV
jgi:two-component sensor histidine kinase